VTLSSSRRRLATLAACALAGLVGVASASAGETPRSLSPGSHVQDDGLPGGVALRPDGIRLALDRLLVRFRAGATANARSTALERAGAWETIRSYSLVPRLELVRLASGHSVAAAADALEANPAVAYADPDYELAPTATPNDPDFNQQWGMTAIDAPAAWDRTTGSALVTVGVIDTGMQMNHPDLAGNLWTNPTEIPGNGIDDDHNGYVDDVHGWDFVNNDNDPSDDINHGTHVSGIIGAIGNNGVGVAGVNWSVRLMPLKICASFCSTSAEISALQYAADENVKVVNSSFGGAVPFSQAEHDAIQAAGTAGILDVAAAGNNSSDNDVEPFYPADYALDNLLPVASTNSAGNLSSFSNFGASSVPLAAPGENILSTFPTSTYQTDSGTSMAAPHVTGGAALLWAEHPTWTYQDVRSRLVQTVKPLSSLAGSVASCGQLNVGNATDPLLAAEAIVCANRSGTGDGSVSSSPAGITCGATCVGTFAPGTSVTLTATPVSGSTFMGWRGPCSGTGTCTVIANDATTATALFRRSGSPSGWNQSVLPHPAARDAFLDDYSPSLSYYSVSLSETGNGRARTIYNPGPASGGFVTCYYDTSDTGGIYLQRKTTSGWVDDGVIHAPSIAGLDVPRWTNCFNFGSVMQLSGDGNRLLLTQDPVDPPPSSHYQCAAFVYAHSSGGWSQEATLFSPDAPTGMGTSDQCGYFGDGGTIARDGSRVAILGWTKLTGDPQGHLFVDVFVRGAGGWTYEQRLNAPHCGDSVAPRYLAMSGDGSRILVGDPFCDTGTPFLGGSVYAFTRSGSTWSLTQTIQAPENVDRLQFGATVALSTDGKTAAISSGSGPAYVYERGSSGWALRRKLTPSGDSNLYCSAVVRSGARVICSSFETVGFNRRQGALYAFDRPVGGWAAAAPVAARAFASDGLAGDMLGTAGPMGWPVFGVTDNGTVIDGPISAVNLSRGYYADHRIGYEFVTPDPLGRLVETPSPIPAGSSAKTLTFTYTATTPLAGGTVTLTVPSGWSAPSTVGTDAGYSTTSQGTLSVSGRTISVTGLTLAKGQIFAITYGASGGATAPSTGGDQTWPASVRLAPSEPLVALVSPPVVRVLAPDGSGTMGASPTNVAHGASGKTLTFTYTAAAGGLAAGSVTLAVPAGWSAPSTTGTSPGFSKASAGTASVAGRTITVSGLNLTSGQKLTITYGAKTSGGPGATAPSATGPQTWTAAEASSATGTLTGLASSPVITIT
jgi:Subtilase family/Divergent InlB B-repeat domain